MSDESVKAVLKNSNDRAADKRDETTRVSQAIINKQNAARDAKTAHLKEARLARDLESATEGEKV